MTVKAVDLLLPGLSKVEVEEAVKALPYSHGFQMIPVFMFSFHDRPDICLKCFPCFHMTGTLQSKFQVKTTSGFQVLILGAQITHPHNIVYLSQRMNAIRSDFDFNFFLGGGDLGF